MFLVMVWHGRRRLAATQDRLTAVEELHRVSQENLRLLEQQRQFLVDASHELGTPITVALGQAQLIDQTVTDQGVAADARVVTGELARLRRLTNRLLLLGPAGAPGVLAGAPGGPRFPDPRRAGAVGPRAAALAARRGRRGHRPGRRRPPRRGAGRTAGER